MVKLFPKTSTAEASLCSQWHLIVEGQFHSDCYEGFETGIQVQLEVVDGCEDVEQVPKQIRVGEWGV